MPGEKTLLNIAQCTVATDGTVSVDASKTYTLMLNPASYTHQYSIGYNKKKAFGQSKPDTRFSGTEAEQVTFDFVIDGTGVVPPATAGTPPADVKTQIQQLNGIVYTYDGVKHEPSHVRVLWGSLIFFGRLETMSVDYVLFKPGGDPLRAKVKVSFVGFLSKEAESLQANRSSPDLLHTVEVKAGDTLPLLCYRIYRDCRYYRQVARVNNLVHFRTLTPGMRLRFPPLR